MLTLNKYNMDHPRTNIDNTYDKMEDQSITVQNKDILCGKGKQSYYHPGNVDFRHQIIRKLDAYTKCKGSHDRASIVEGVIYTMENNNGSRFLRRNQLTGAWVSMDHRQVRDKITIAFRDIMKRQQSAKARRAAKERKAKADEIERALQGRKKKAPPQPASFQSSSQQQQDDYDDDDDDDENLLYEGEEDNEEVDQSMREFRSNIARIPSNTSSRVSTDLRHDDTLATYFPARRSSTIGDIRSSRISSSSSAYHQAQAQTTLASLNDINNTFLYARLPTPASASASTAASSIPRLHVDDVTSQYNTFLSNELMRSLNPMQQITSTSTSVPYYPFPFSLQDQFLESSDNNNDSINTNTTNIYNQNLIATTTDSIIKQQQQQQLLLQQQLQQQQQQQLLLQQQLQLQQQQQQMEQEDDDEQGQQHELLLLQQQLQQQQHQRQQFISNRSYDDNNINNNDNSSTSDDDEGDMNQKRRAS